MHCAIHFLILPHSTYAHSYSPSMLVYVRGCLMFSGCELYRSDDTYIVLTLLVPQLSSELFIPYIIIITAIPYSWYGCTY